MSTVHDKRYWQRLAERRKEEIERLRDVVEGYEDGQSGIYAMIAAVVQKVGAVTITREEINEIIREGKQPRILLDPVTWAYTLSMEDESNGSEG